MEDIIPKQPLGLVASGWVELGNLLPEKKQK